VQLEGLYLGLWYRAAVTGADGAGAHLLYLDSEDTEVLGPADFEARSWRVWGRGRGDEEARSSDLSTQEERGEGAASSTAGRSDPHGAVGRGPGLRTHVAGWEAQLARLVGYKAAHGDCNVPHRWAEDPQLGTWVNNQRARKRKLDRGEPSAGMTASRAARLTALGFEWDPPVGGGQPNEAEWAAQLARLAAYKAAHGDCSVPQRWPKDPRLGSWVFTQRRLKRKLDRGEPSDGMTAERAVRLTALGFSWDQNEAQWEVQLARLVDYKAARGDCSVPAHWAQDPRLGFWVNAQRNRKRKLDRGEPSDGMTAERAARLTALGLVWDPPRQGGRQGGHPKEAEWDSQFERLAAYMAAHGNCSVPQRWVEDPGLGKWLSNQRHLKRKLDRGEPNEGMTVARAARLTALGLVWDLRRVS
jgi:hypothetical protein